MAITKVETIYTGHDNRIDLILEERVPPANAPTPADLSKVTRVTLKFDTLVADSNVAGSGQDQPFDWTAGNGLLKLKLGGLGIPPSGNGYFAKLTVYSPAMPNGVVFGEIPTEVK